MIGVLTGAVVGLLVWLIIGMILGEIATRYGNDDAFRDWIDTAPHVAGMSILGWIQIVIMLIGGTIGAWISL